MAARHGRNAAVYIGTTALSAYCDTVDLSIDNATADTTTFGSSWTTAIAGLNSGSVSLSGIYDPTATTGPQAVLWGVITGGTAWPIAHFPGGSASGQRTNTFSALITSYSESSPVADKVTFSVSLQITGAVTSGTVS